MLSVDLDPGTGRDKLKKITLEASEIVIISGTY